MNETNVEGIPRTNNHVDGWCNSINSLLSCQHPKMFKFLNDLMDEQEAQDIKMVQIEAGESPEKRDKK